MIRVGAVKFGLTGRSKKGGHVSPNPGQGGGIGMGPKDAKEKNKPGRPGGGTTAPADNVITYNGEAITYNGEPITYTA